MIRVQGSVHRSYLFPAPRQAAFEYYSHFPRVVEHLPLISIERSFSHNQFRVVYQSTELGIYNVKIFCDVAVVLDKARWVLLVKTINHRPTVPSRASWRATQAQGVFASQSVFHDQGNHTRIEYKLHLLAQLPPPTGLRLMPAIAINQIASSITRWRMDDIIDSFIQQSIEAYTNTRGA